MMATSALASLVALAVLLRAGGVVRFRGTRQEGEGNGLEVAFAQFLQQQGRTYALGSKEYRRRLERFRAHTAAAEEQNRKVDRTWTAGVNALADRTPEELAKLFGYRRTARPSSASRGSLGLVSAATHNVNLTALPTDWSWRGKLQAMSDVRNQRECGSCWAVSTATVLRAHAELYREDRSFSSQQMVNCVPNEQSCGGTGGCEGATAELAMDYVVKVGLVTEAEVSYLGQAEACPVHMQLPAKTSTSEAATAFSELGRQEGGSAFGMLGWSKLPENAYGPLMVMVHDVGPVVVSVAAGYSWFLYKSGVLPGCEKGGVINHAVSLVGYGMDPSSGKRYWHIQNSWGDSWGEAGFLRLQRHEEEEAYCGEDDEPLVGTGCRGGPDKVTICGNCGILYDNVVPKFESSPTGWMSRNRGKGAAGADLTVAL